MSVIAWDGRYLASDKMAVCAEMGSVVTKAVRLEDDSVAAWCGNADCGSILLKWYIEGADPAKWPEFQSNKEYWTRLVIASRDGVIFYEQFPSAQRVEQPFIAFGSGRDFAMGAMAKGASAKEAVEIASRFCVSCGLGVDVFDVLHSKLKAVED